MPTRHELTAYLDQLLVQSTACRDSSNNGLQVEGAGEVSKVVFGVDACVALFERAAQTGAEYVVVHHGLSWRDSLKYLTSVNSQRVGTLFRNHMSLYASHLPLDMHPDVGHNAQISKLLGLGNLESRFEYGGVPIGFAGDLPTPMSLPGLVAEVDGILDTSSKCLAFGPERISRVGVVSGGGGDAIEECVPAEVDCLVTGEIIHQHWHVARECAVNVVAAGHYKSETPGLAAVMERVAREFEVECEFIDIPTGL
jgi:dinuclear metal center YbgI/SA1388 family protein